jgi:prepilin-type N-terminal cleavage/methylation domain-containing protein
MRRSSRNAGFTLIELMMVTAIIGALATVAIPNFLRLSMRAKQAERATIMLKIKQAVVDRYVRTGSIAPDNASDPGNVTVTGAWNPPLPVGSGKKMMLNNQSGWNVYFTGTGGSGNISSEIEGALYYSYQFTATEVAGASTLFIEGLGDLDGDGNTSDKVMWFNRVQGSYQLTSEVPAAGEEGDVF